MVIALYAPKSYCKITHNTLTPSSAAVGVPTNYPTNFRHAQTVGETPTVACDISIDEGFSLRRII